MRETVEPTCRQRDASASEREDPLEPLESWVTPTELRSLDPRRGLNLQTRYKTKAAHSRNGRSLAYQQAITATCWSFVATFAFGLGVVLPLKGRAECLNFVTAFLVEKSLSVDNLFVFLMIFEYFKVPEQHTQRVLKWGILTALMLRGVMIAVGVAVVQRFRPVLLVFALVLVASAVKMLQPEEEAQLNDNFVLKVATRLVDSVDYYDGDRFFTSVKGERKATPLLVVLIMIEMSDVIFAVDSIPAVVGITHDPLVVYSSNIFALMALRSLYLLLSKSVQSLHYLRHAVALVLLFVGVKMILDFVHVVVTATTSLAVILLLLGGGVAASLARNAGGNAAQAAATTESLRHSAQDSV